jgi:outer membrane protein OmpA-like peptidoglycan-associated protein
MKLKSLIFLIVLNLFSGFSAVAQQENYYVVVGAFSIEANAQKLVEKANGLSKPAFYAFNDSRKLFYVYVRATQNREDAMSTFGSIKEEGLFEAWVYHGNLSGELHLSERTEAVVVSAPVNPPRTEIISSPKQDEPVITPVVFSQPEEKPQESMTPPLAEVEEKNPKTVATASTPAGKPFVFKLLSANGSPISGQVQLLESEKANQFRGFKGNEKVYVVPPNNRGGKWYIVCSVVGFQTYKKSFTYGNPEQFAGASLGNEQEYVLPLTLSRVKKGDYIELDGVKFFENSNVLTPQSESELSELLAMMQENNAYKIKLHGHTNGDQGRNIISREEPQNFFVLETDNKRFDGTAKLLSTLRAETVRNYLISKGIDAQRIAVKGEGGKQPVYDPKGTSAASNARVEVEITKH